jgi:outer membrane protein assembly factor BamB
VAASSWPGLTVVEDTAYLAYNQYVRAVDLSSGMELWSYPSDEDSQATFFAPPAISPDGIVVVGSYDNQALALEPNEPFVSVLWPFEHATDRIIGGPVIVDDWVLVPSADNHLYALDMESGTQVWNKPFEAQHGLWSSPTVQDDRIYIASLDHHIYALELENGQEIWSTNLSSAVSDSPSLTDGLVLAGSIEGILFALDADNGKIIWQFTADDAIWGSPAVVDGVAYFADVSGSAYALEAASGNELWRVELPGSSSASPTIMDDRIFFVIETGEVTALLLESGAPVWPSSAEMAGRLLADAVLTDHGLLLPAMDSECEIFNVDPSTGATRCIIEPK